MHRIRDSWGPSPAHSDTYVCGWSGKRWGYLEILHHIVRVPSDHREVIEKNVLGVTGGNRGVIELF